MDSSELKFTVLFEEPYWVGIYECQSHESYEVGKVVFGAEPKDCEIYEMILKQWYKVKLSAPIEIKSSDAKRINPKRMQRAIKRQVQDKGMGTKAQEALKKQHEQTKMERKSYSRQQKEQEKERQFELKQEKRKKKHRGH